MPVNGNFRQERLERVFLFLGKYGRGFNEVERERGEEVRGALS